MKNAGIIRQVDKNGRLVIPKEMRKMLKVQDDVDSFEIFAENDKIILQKYEPRCVFCSETENTLEFEGRTVCFKCIDLLKTKKDSEQESLLP